MVLEVEVRREAQLGFARGRLADALETVTGLHELSVDGVAEQQPGIALGCIGLVRRRGPGHEDLVADVIGHVRRDDVGWWSQRDVGRKRLGRQRRQHRKQEDQGLVHADHSSMSSTFARGTIAFSPEGNFTSSTRAFDPEPST